MKPAIFILVMLVLLGGCRSSQKSAENDKKTSSVYAATRVYVNGRDRGAVPGTVRVRRSFNEDTVVLRKGRTVLRRYELERVYTSNASELVYGFSGSNSAEGTTFDLTSLKVSKDSTTYIIPHLSKQFVVEDRQYGLTLVIAD